MRYLGIDVGSTYLKSAILDLSKNQTGVGNRIPAPAFAVTDLNGKALPDGGKEIPLQPLADAVKGLIREAAKQDKIEGVLFSVQMHGFALFSPEGRPLTHYVTWQDTRGSQTVLEHLRRTEFRDLFAENGIIPLPNHSVVPLLHLAQEKGIPKGAQFSMLGDALVRMLTGKRVGIHPTNAASSGLYSLKRKNWNEELMNRLGLQDLDFPCVEETLNPVAVLCVEGAEIPLYTALGDQQASVLGIGAEKGDFFLNIATGGQAGCVTDDFIPGSYETRPFFDGSLLRTFTQLPSGRSVQLLQLFLQSIGREVFGLEGEAAERSWHFLNEPVNNPVLDALKVCPDFFTPDGGSISGISAENFTASSLKMALYEAMVREYVQALKALDPGGQLNGRLLCTGGAIRKNPALFEEIQKISLRRCEQTPGHEDSMEGLLRYAKRCQS